MPGMLSLSSLPYVKGVRALLFVPLVRLLERLLPVPALLAIFLPLAAWRALSSWVLKKEHRLEQRPAWLRAEDPFQPSVFNRLHWYLNQTLLYFPDRLNHPKWRRRCRFVGLEHLRSPGGTTGPILAFLHFGPYQLLRSWLRAAGLPVSVLVSYRAHERSQFMKWHHRRTPFAEVPPTFHLENLVDAIRHLQAGRPLAMALDSDRGRMMQVPLADGWSLPTATGAIRLARKHEAPLLACSIRCEGPWRHVVEISAPVPAALWWQTDEEVGSHLLAHLFPLLRRHPDQCLRRLVRQIQPARSRDALLKTA